jgi:amino acid transporter
MFERIKTFLVGNALKDTDLSTEKFSVKWGLPIYSSDAISSVAYAGEEMLIVLVPALFMGAYKYYILCIAAILFLLVILAISYSQTIDAYPNGGGAYGVATENLGKIPGLIAGAALIIGYILTVAASSAAATAAIYSAFPVLQPYRVFIALGIIALLTWGNLRGMRESAVMFGTPTYMFIAIIVITILVGAVKAIIHPEMVPKAASFSYQPTMLRFCYQRIYD